MAGLSPRETNPAQARIYHFRDGATGAKERTRRASAVLCASITPDRFVVTADREQQTVLLPYIARPDQELDPRLAGMTQGWLLASLGLIPPPVAAVIACGRRAVGLRLVAVELATSLSVLVLIALRFAFDQASSIDLALTLTVLSLPGTLVIALFEERWLRPSPPTFCSASA